MANRILGRVSRFWDQRQTVERTNRTKRIFMVRHSGKTNWGKPRAKMNGDPGQKRSASLSTMVSPMFSEAVAAGEGALQALTTRLLS